MAKNLSLFFHKFLGVFWYFTLFIVIVPFLVLRVGQSLDWLFLNYFLKLDLSFSEFEPMLGYILAVTSVAFLAAGAILIFQAILTLAKEALVFPFGVTSSKHLRPEKLAKSGPYGFVRHPMLLGYLFVLVSLGISQRSFLTVFWSVPLFAWAAMEYLKLTEEKMLSCWFGKEYAEYQKKVPALIPWRT